MSSSENDVSTGCAVWFGRFGGASGRLNTFNVGLLWGFFAVDLYQLSQRGPPAQSRYFKCGHDSRRLNFGFRQTKIVKSLSSGKAYCERTWAAGRITLNNLPNSALRNPIATTTAVGRLSGP